jgi:hypothetical protein
MSSAWDGLLNTKECTELPHYAINKHLPADSYFTSPKTAKKCLDILYSIIDKNAYRFIEPSAGSGVFYDMLPINKIGIELFNRRPDFIQQDFLTWYPSDDKKPTITVGNPPFGHRGAYALAFVNRALLFSDYVAFILPMSFHSNGKGSNMRRVKNAHLIKSVILEKEEFFSPDANKLIKINTLFQVWKRGDGPAYFKDYNVSDIADIYTVCSSPDRLCGLDKLNKYDLYVASTYYGNTLNSVKDFKDVKYGSGYGIILKDKSLLEPLMSVEWDQYACFATNSCKHIRKHSIKQCITDLKQKHH